MKKLTIILAFMTVLCAVSVAQDTILSGYPKDNYFYKNKDWVHGNGILSSGLYLGGGGSMVEIARAYHTNHPLQVTGLAVMLALGDVFTNNSGVPIQIQDTTLDSVYCDVRLYKSIGDSLHVVKECRVHMRDTPVSYMQEMSQTNTGAGGPIVKPVYECLFDTSIVVTDSFYVGIAPNNAGSETYEASTGTFIFLRKNYVLLPIFFGNEDRYQLKEPETIAYRRGQENIPAGHTPGTWLIQDNYYPQGFHFMFAIVDTAVTPIDTTDTPIDSTDTPVDTTVTPVDSTMGVNGVDMVGRYVSVSPNPAGDRATVLSSFGLTAIEAYDPQGRQLQTLPATGMKAELDVSAWPRGTVLLHIHTPAGTAVKKLLLR